MKKVFRLIMISFIMCILSISFVACTSNSNAPENDLPNDYLDNGNQSENTIETNKYTHTIKIDNETLFDYYFTFNATNTMDYHYHFNDSTGTKSTSTITISPKLTGFVDYSGYVELQAETETENKSSKVLKSRHINIEYWGTTTDIYEVNNETKQNDSTISFNDVNYKFKSADMAITYHHEGVSGNLFLSYETIYITKYNYKSYFTIKIENQSYRTTSYNEYDYNHRNPIYTYHYYQTYTVTPSTQIKGYKEFNHIILTFDNGVVVELDALGKCTYKSQEYSVEKAIPTLSKINGCIDFYPPAICEY